MAYKDINCPYCEHPQNINHDGGQGYSEDETHQQECENCKKTFIYTTAISFSYDVDKAECLNTDEDTHLWEATTTYPEFMKKMRCCVCDSEREPTAEERVKYNIPTYQDYMNQIEEKQKDFINSITEYRNK